MTKNFEVIKAIINPNRGLFIFARHLGSDHDFIVPDDSLFGDLPIYNYRDIQPIKDKDGNPEPDVFVFRPIDMKQLFEKQFSEGQKVTLTFI